MYKKKKVKVSRRSSVSGIRNTHHSIHTCASQNIVRHKTHNECALVTINAIRPQ